MTDAQGEPRVDLPRQLARRLLPAAIAVGVLIGIVAPALIWHFQVQATRESAEIYARDFERQLQLFILETGPLWRYQAQKYFRTLETFVPEKEIRHIGITDDHGVPLTALEYIAKPAGGEWPNRAVHISAPIHFNNRVVAYVIMEVSTARATVSAFRLFIVLGFAGIAFGMFLFALPVSVARRLDRQVQHEMEARTALYLAAEQHLAQTRRLAVVAHEIAGTLDWHEAATRAVDGAAALFGAHPVRLWHIDHEAPHEPILAVGTPAADHDVTRVAAVLATRDTRREAVDGAAERWIVPLVVGEHCAGALDLTTAAIVAAAEAELIGLFASKVAIALVNCELHEAARRALKQVTEQNAELDSFVHTVSHDLKAPLIAIRGFAAALEEALPADGDTEVAHYVQRIVTNVEHMSRLLRDMLELSQVGRSGLTADAVPIGPVIEEVLGDLQDAIDARGVTVVIGELGEVWGVRSELHSIFQNLVGNAVKYLGDTPRPCIEIGRRSHNGVPEYFVRDNGIGIDPAYHDKIFRIFERLHDIPAAGTGVGLAIVRRIVDRAGGHARVEFERGLGATFSFTWPRPAAASSLAPAALAR